MNKKRRNQFESKVAVSDEELLITTTNVFRQYARKFQRRKVPLVTKNGTAVTDENGHIIMIDVEPEERVSMSDVKTAVQLQRLIRGLPSKIEQTDEAPLDISMDEIIRRLGLTDEDFVEENYGETLVKISKYISKYKSGA